MPPEFVDPPEGPRPDAAVPDLKQTQANNPSGFAWNAGAAKAAASAAVSRRPPEKTWIDRLKSPYVMGGGVALALVGGGAVFYVTSVGMSDAGTAVSLDAVHSSVKYHPVRGQGSLAFAPRGAVDDVRQDRMHLDAIAAAEKKSRKAGGKGGDGADGGDGGDQPMNYDTDGKGGGSGASASVGGPAGAAKDGGANGGGGGGGNAYPKLTSSVNMRGMKMVSGTAGFHGLKKGRGILRAASSNHGPGSNPSGGTNGADVADSGSVGAGGGDGAGGGGGGGSGFHLGGGDSSASGAGGGAGGGGGGSGDGADGPQDTTAQIQALMVQAAGERDKAEKDKKMAEFLAAGGQLPQAKWHYDRYEKEKKSADEKQAAANALMQTMQTKTDALITPQPAPVAPKIQ